MSIRILYASVAVAALACTQAARAQVQPVDEPAAQTADTTASAGPTSTSSTSRTTVYAAAFFASFAPRTALDIARRVPGFSLDLGDSETRGFAGAAGNVVINGARPSSKAEPLETTLARIPSRSVVRVEVGPGDLYGADYSGKSQVLNVILSEAAGIDGNVTASARREYHGRVSPNASASAMIKRGASTINLSAGTERSYNFEEGTDTLTFLESGGPLEYRRKFNEYIDRRPYASASWALERAADNSIRVNARYSPQTFDLEQWNRAEPLNGEARDDSLIQDYSNPVFELGGDITRPLAGGAIKFVALATRRKRNNFDAYIERDGLRSEAAEVVGGFDQTQKARLGETIGRLSWTRQNLSGFSVEAGGEAVLNTLKSDVELFVTEDGERSRIDLPIDSATVKEKRGEAFVNIGRNLAPALRVDAGMAVEHSRLKVRGDATADRNLTFLKPNVAIDWKPGGDWHTQLSIRRTVAQLNFYDFISAAELSNDRVNAGNQNLLPQRAWEFRMTADHPILGDGLVKLDIGHDRISLLQDRVLIFDEDGDAFDAPGNIGTGKRMFGRVTVDAPLGSLWAGLRVKLTGQLQRTRVEDPISGEQRNFSDFFPDWEWSIDARRDLGALSYGFVLSHRDKFTFFRTDEFDSNYNSGPFATAFVEYRVDPRTAITLDVENALNTRGMRERLIFAPNRADPDIAVRELRERNRHLNFGLTLKRSFGRGAASAAA